jgi:hypothetical protein
MKTPISEILSLIGREDVRAKMRAAASTIPALPLLEYALVEIQSIEHQLPAEAQLKDILHTAMISPSGHWASCALEWIIQGFPIDEDVVEWHETCKDNKRISQRIRQAAHSLINKK